jgi:hypothetical protein
MLGSWLLKDSPDHSLNITFWRQETRNSGRKDPIATIGSDFTLEFGAIPPHLPDELYCGDGLAPRL